MLDRVDLVELLSASSVGERADAAAHTAAETGTPSSRAICCAAASVSKRHAIPACRRAAREPPGSAHITLASNLQFLHQLRGGFFGMAVEDLRAA